MHRQSGIGNTPLGFGKLALQQPPSLLCGVQRPLVPGNAPVHFAQLRYYHLSTRLPADFVFFRSAVKRAVPVQHIHPDRTTTVLRSTWGSRSTSTRMKRAGLREGCAQVGRR
jgi:hypothetical protein